MVGKVFLTSKSFAETCEYLRREQSQSKVLSAEGVRTHDHRLMAEDFEWQHRLMPEKEKPVFHSVLSFPAGESVEDARLVEIAKKYLQKIEVVNTQYAFVKHTDKEHLHVHVIANRVNNDGDPTGKGLIIERSIKAAKELTREYGLRPEQGKHLGRTHMEALHEPDSKRYRIYAAISEELPRSLSLSDLEERLQRQGISVQYRVDAATDRRQGISFRLENRSFKGSRVDTAYSLKGLERTLVLQERRVQEEKVVQSLERLVKGRLVGWDEQESVRRRQELKDGLAKAEERLKPKREEELSQDLRQEEHLVQRRGLRL